MNKKERRIFVLSLGINAFVLVVILLSLAGLNVKFANKVIVDRSDYDNFAEVSKIMYLKDEIKKNYYIDISDEQIKEGMLRGMLAYLPDGYSRYYSKNEIDIRRNYDSGKDILIGVMISRDENKRYYISGVDKDKTAYEAGIKVGDILLFVNGIEVNDDTIDSVREELKSQEKENGEYKRAKIKVLRNDKEIEFVVKRKEYVESSIYSRKINDIGYIQITKFIETTYSDFKKVADEFKKDGINKVILDLRDNPGGFVNQAVDVAGSLVGNKTIFYQSFRDGNLKENKYLGFKVYDFELVVLTNENTASAAELLVGALKTYERAVIIGSTTFGKGIIQTTYSLKSDDAYQITTSEYLIPDKTKIHKIGIKPNIIFEKNEDLINKAKEILENNAK